MTGGPDLGEYRARRDFGATPEPAPPAAPEPSAGAPRFVVQRHDARALHHDLRLEVGGALASWAVPKGVPLREGPRRLAVRTEDHPLEYLDFAGVIPEGQYGAGRMSVWDAGTYEPQLLGEREWKVVLSGRILRGHYHLVRTGSARGRSEWLLFRSGKGPPGPPDPAPAFRALRPVGALRADEPFDDPGWAFELAWDGRRALALVGPDGLELRGEEGEDLAGRAPALGDLRRALMCQEAVLDGELVALDADGRPRPGEEPATYMAVDLLYADGEWLTGLPWRERRARLAGAVSPEGPPRLMVSGHLEGRGRDVHRLAAERGLGGIVAKRLDDPYRPGRADWREVRIRPAPAPRAAAGPPPGPFGGASGERVVEEGGRRVTLTSLDKPYWPREGIAKGHLLDHYLRMAPVLVPHIAGRPMVLKRYPEGIEGEWFFQHTVQDAPPWLRRVDLSRGGRPGERTMRYAVVDDPLGLLWLVNLGCIDLNPWQSTADAPDRPTHVLFDLDPSEGVPFARVAETALLVREALEGLGLRGYPRTSGATGMHVIVPIAPGPGFDATREFARAVAEAIRRVRPELVTTTVRVAARGPRVYIDANQNGRGRSIAAVYSVRPRPGAPVAAPLRWEEVGPGLDPRDLTMAEVARRVEREGDLHAPVLEDLQDLAPAAAGLPGPGA